MTTLAFALAFSALGSWRDVRTGRLSDAWALTGLFVAFAWHGATGGAPAIGMACFGAVAAALGPLVLYVLGAIGGGDVKATAVLGALLGARLALSLELMAFAAVALVGIVLALRRGLARSLLDSVRVLLRRMGRARGEPVPEAAAGTELPMAPFLTGALVLALAWHAIG